MANEWLRLWHDMPNDPKFKTVARVSKQPISLVISFYVHMLVEASKHKVRGTVDLSTEDIASALDVSEEEIQSVLDAMQGRLIDGNRLSGWEVRQPKKEEGSEGGKAATDNYVYYLGTTDGYKVKVGFSRNPWSRLSDLQAGSAKKYELFAVMKTTTRSEFEIHKFFNSSRLNGEWFARTDALNLLIEKTKSKEVSSHEEAIDFLRSLDDSMFDRTTKNYGSESSATKEEDKDKEEIKIKSKTTTSAKAPKFDFSAKLSELGADEKSIRDWLAVRKLKRAANTETVIENLIREAEKAGISVADAVLICATRSWQGFEASWLKPQQQAAPAQGDSKLGVHGRASANAARKWLERENG